MVRIVLGQPLDEEGEGYSDGPPAAIRIPKPATMPMRTPRMNPVGSRRAPQPYPTEAPNARPI